MEQAIKKAIEGGYEALPQLKTMDKTLNELEVEMRQITSEWNGDESGAKEDRANVAQGILEAIKNIKELLIIKVERLEGIEDGVAYFEHRIEPDRVSRTSLYVEQILLDPLFWQALGKQQGWTEIDKIKEKTIKMAGGIPRNIDGINGNIGYHTLHYWHSFIDHIAEGKSADSFFEGLLK